jgi:hypothetical protein
MQTSNMREALVKMHPLIAVQLSDFMDVAASLGAKVISTTHFSAVMTAMPTDDPMRQLVIAHDVHAEFTAANYISVIKPGNLNDTHYVTVQYKLPRN